MTTANTNQVSSSEPSTYVAPQGSGLATASLICGIFLCFPPASLAAVILGIVGLNRSKAAQVGGEGKAIAGIVLGALGLILLAPAILAPALLAHGRDAANRVRCAANLRQIGTACLRYSFENEKYPQDLEVLVNNGYLTRADLNCPSSKPSASSPGRSSYVYLGANMSQSTPASAILAYESIADHDDGLNLLFNDGHVVFNRMSAQKAAKMMEQLQAGQNPPLALSEP
jgi:prepilin-type processing-associated H-X9-DG protein